MNRSHKIIKVVTSALGCLIACTFSWVHHGSYIPINCSQHFSFIPYVTFKMFHKLQRIRESEVNSFSWSMVDCHLLRSVHGPSRLSRESRKRWIALKSFHSPPLRHWLRRQKSSCSEHNWELIHGDKGESSMRSVSTVWSYYHIYIFVYPSPWYEFAAQHPIWKNELNFLHTCCTWRFVSMSRFRPQVSCGFVSDCSVNIVRVFFWMGVLCSFIISSGWFVPFTNEWQFFLLLSYFH